MELPIENPNLPRWGQIMAQQAANEASGQEQNPLLNALMAQKMKGAVPGSLGVFGEPRGGLEDMLGNPYQGDQRL